MSGTVDVLAVLRKLRSSHECGDMLPPVTPVIDAVAELIEAAGNALAKVHSYNPVRPDATACMVRLRAALARCKGEQA